MVISAGKSRKNVNAYVILPPDAKSAIDLLIKFRKEVGIPETNPYIFARLNADTPFSGNTEMAEIVSKCPGLQHPERITSTSLRKYIATVSQVCFVYCEIIYFLRYCVTIFRVIQCFVWTWISLIKKQL